MEDGNDRVSPGAVSQGVGDEKHDETGEPDAKGKLHLSRRVFLQSSGALVGSTGLGWADGALPRPFVWHVEAEADPLVRDRLQYLVSLRVHSPTANVALPPGHDAPRILREIAFGERARISVTPSPTQGPHAKVTFGDGDDGAAKAVDQRLTIAGVDLVGRSDKADAFDLTIDLKHGARTSKGSVEIGASGWIFGGGTRLGSFTSDQWCTGAFDFDVPGLIVAAFAAAVFGKRLVAPEKGMKRLGLSIIAADRPVRWQLSNVPSKPDGPPRPDDMFKVPTDIPGVPMERAMLSAAAGLDVWREAMTVRPTAKPGAKPADPAHDSSPQTARVDLVELAAPVTIGVFAKPVALGPLLLGTCRMPGDAMSVALIDGPIHGDRGTRLTRRQDRSGASRIKAEIDTSGTLRVEAARAGGRLRRDGGFCVGDGTIVVEGASDGGTPTLAAAFNVTRGGTVATAFGPLQIVAPEQKRTLDTPPVPGSDAEPGRQVIDVMPVRIEAAAGALTRFEVVAAIVSAGVALETDAADACEQPVDPQPPQNEYRVDLGFPGGAEVLFRLHGLTDRATTRPAIGRIALGGFDALADGTAPAYSLPLEDAVLRLTRWRDLLALTYRFSGLDLTLDGGCFRLRPRGLAREATANLGVNPRTDDPVLAGSVVDTRPLMVVEFPPQHVAEEAFFEQRPARLDPPAFPLAAAPPAQAAEMRAVYDDLRRLYVGAQSPPGGTWETALAQLRLAARQRFQALYLAIPLPAAPPPGGSLSDIAAFVDFAGRFGTTSKDSKSLPAEQKIYIGPEFLDPEARKLAEGLTRADTAPPFDYLPEDPVSDSDRLAIGDRLFRVTGRPVSDLQSDIEKKVDELRKSREPAFQAFQQKWLSIPLPAQIPDAFHRFSGRAAWMESIEDARKAGVPADAVTALDTSANRAWLDVLADLHLRGDEKVTSTARHFLSGPSRLAFRINTDDVRDNCGGAMLFSADSLTNWARHELVVVRRAQKLFNAYREGVRRPAWDRLEVEDLADKLLAQGFSRGGWKTPAEGDPPTRRSWPEALVTAEQRLGEVAAFAKTAPGAFETSIEMPYRLHLSPAQDGRFRTRRTVPAWVFEGTPPGLATETMPLWTADFEVLKNSALRAVWSPDFRPEAFVRRMDGLYSLEPVRANAPPPKGPYAPWMMSRDWRDVPSDQADALHFRTSLDAYDRHELVTLSSVPGLPVVGKVDTAGLRLGVDQREPPEGFQVSTGGWGTQGPDVRTLAGLNDVYVPRPFDVEGLQLSLSALGGFLRMNAGFDPPAAVYDGKGAPYFPALSVERWRHRIVLGRDISAEVVYKGYLFPIGVRAALVKITERRFEGVAGRSGPVAVLRQRMFLRLHDTPKTFGAFRHPDNGRRVPFKALRMTMLHSPDIVDPYDNDTRSIDGVYPSGRIDCKNLPATQAGGGREPNGTAFWPRISKRMGGEVRFDFLLDDKVPARLPFVFVDNTAANDSESLARLTAYYDGLSGATSEHGTAQWRDPATTPSALVTLALKGAKLTYAPEAKAGDTQYETYDLVLAAEGGTASLKTPDASALDQSYRPLRDNNLFVFDPFLQGVDQPPFYPAMRFATIKIAQIARVTGQPAPLVRAVYDPSYARAGFDANDAAERKNPQDIFLAVIAKANVSPETAANIDEGSLPRFSLGASGDRGGAVARPETRVVALSRKLGPIGLNATGDPYQGYYPTVTSDYDAPPAIAFWFYGSDTRTGTSKRQTGAAAAVAHAPPPAPLVAAAGQDPPKFAGAFFDENAKLAGIVPLRLLFEIVDGEDIFPKIQELLDFGGGLAGATDDAIRSNVLEPLETGLQLLSDRLDAIDMQVKADGGLSVRQVYGDVFESLDALLASLQAALGNPKGDTIAAAIVEVNAYTAIYAAGRTFLAALDRAVRDPITPLTEAARALLQGQINDVWKEFLKPGDIDALNHILDLTKDAAHLRALARDWLLQQVLDQAIDTLMPPPPSGFLLLVNGHDDLVWAALKSTLQDATVWPGIATPGKVLFDPAAFRTVLAAKFSATADVSWVTVYPGDDVIALANQVGAVCDALSGLIAIATGDIDAATRSFMQLAPLGQTLLNATALAQAGQALSKICGVVPAALADIVDASLPTLDPGKLPACVAVWTDASGVDQHIAGCAAWPPTPAGHFDVAAATARVLRAASTVTGALGTLAQDPNATADLKVSVGTLTSTFSGLNNVVRDRDVTNGFKKLSNDRAAFLSATQAGGACAKLSVVGALLRQGRALFASRQQLVEDIAVIATRALDALQALAPVLTHLAPQATSASLLAPTPDADPATWILGGTTPTGPGDVATMALTLAIDVAGLAVRIIENAGDAMLQLTIAGRSIADPGKALATKLATIVPDVAALKSRADEARAWLNGLQDRIDQIKGQFTALADRYGSLVTAFEAIGTAAPGARLQAATDFADAATDVQSQIAPALNICRKSLDDLIGDVGAGWTKLFGAGNAPWSEAALVVFLTPAGGALGQAVDHAIGLIQPVLGPQVAGLSTFFGTAVATRSGIDMWLDGVLGTGLTGLAAVKLRQTLYAALTAPSTPATSLDQAKANWAADTLARQATTLASIATALSGPPPPATPPNGSVPSHTPWLDAVVALATMLQGWGRNPTSVWSPTASGAGAPNAVAVIIAQVAETIADLLRDVVRGKIAALIDFDAVKREMEARLRDFAPTKLTLTYDLGTELANFPDGDDDTAIFLPDDGTRLTLQARSVIDLQNIGKPPEIQSTGIVGPFRVNLLGGFMNIITLHFDGARFGSDTGGKLKANIIGAEIGDAIQFLEDLSSFFSFGADGFYLSLLFDPPGIEAGYRLPPCGFALGALGVSNISLNAGIVIPFTDAPALFKVGVSTPELPFLINVGIYGGGGHVALYSTAQGIIGFEASFEFGAVVSFHVGPINGQGRVTAGVFLRSFKAGSGDDAPTASTIEAMVTAAGSASIAIFHISAMLQVRAGQDARGDMFGTALFTFSFSVGLTHVDFRVTARHDMGKGFKVQSGLVGGADPRSGTQFAQNPVRIALNDNGSVSDAGPLGGVACPGDDAIARLRSDVHCKGDDYRGYEAYFDRASPFIRPVWLDASKGAKK